MELLIVVMLLGVLAGVAAPRYQAALAGVHLEAAAKGLAADLRRARSVATTRSTSATVAFNVAAGSYASADLSDPDHPAQTLAVSVARRGHGLSISAADFGGDAEVTFDFRGEPAAAGSVTLTNGTNSAVVAVNDLGYVEVN